MEIANENGNDEASVRVKEEETKSLEKEEEARRRCHLCEKSYLLKTTLDAHIKSFHENKIGKFKCEKCHKRFLLKEELKSHLMEAHNVLNHGQIHQGHEKITCRICKESFSQTKYLNAHIEKVHEKVRRLKCRKCDETFLYHDGLIKHQREIHDITFSCHNCGKRFIGENTLKYHSKNCHSKLMDQEKEEEKEDEERLACSICNRHYRDKESLEKHEEMVHHVCKCDICEKSFRSKSFLEGHLKLIHKKCHLCNLQFDDNLSLYHHLQNQHANSTSSASSAEKKSNQVLKVNDKMNQKSDRDETDLKPAEKSKVDLKSKYIQLRRQKMNSSRWKRAPKSESPVKCDICGKQMANKTNLQRHIKFCHFKEGPKCHHCGVRMHDKYTLIRHLRCVHKIKMKAWEIPTKSNHSNHGSETMNVDKTKDNVENRPPEEDSNITDKVDQNFKCQLCHENLSSQIELKQHFKSIHERKNSRCIFCTKCFRSDVNLLSHLKTIHNIERDSVIVKHLVNKSETKLTNRCQICKNVFKSRKSLREHFRIIHAQNRKMYQCQSCGIKYKYRRSLNHHMETIHHPQNRKTLQCQICKNIYKSQTSLREHLRVIHAKNRKTYKCQSCGMRILRKASLKKHVRSAHSGSDGSNCPICNIYFSKYSMSYHMKNAHDVAKNPEILEKLVKNRIKNNTSNLEQIDPDSQFEFPELPELIETKSTKTLNENENRNKGSTSTENKCGFCDKLFTSKRSLQDHIKYVHLKEGPTCLICNIKFQRPSTLKEHMRNIHKFNNEEIDSLESTISGGSNRFTSPDRPDSSEIYYSLEKRTTRRSNPLRSNEEIITINSTINGESNRFTSPNQSEKRMTRRSNPLRSKEEIENIESTINEINGGSNPRTSPENHVLPFHSKDNKRSIIKCDPIKTNEEDCLYPCNICGIKLQSERNLKNHIENVHEKSGGTVCQFCNIYFSRHYLPQHMKLAHNFKDNPEILKEIQTTNSNFQSESLNCPICIITFVTITNFKRHLKSVHDLNEDLELIDKNNDESVPQILRSKSPNHCENPSQRDLENLVNFFHDNDQENNTKIKTESQEMEEEEDNFKENVECYECPICGSTYHDETLMQRHIKRVHEMCLKEDKECSQSQQMMNKFKRDYDDNVDEQHQQGNDEAQISNIPCSFCQLKLNDESSLNTHINEFHGTKTCKIILKQLLLPETFMTI